MVRVCVTALGNDIHDGISNLIVCGESPLQLRPDLVAIKVYAASVNYPDLLMTCGGYQYKPVLPYTPGTEASGVVVGVGTGVKTLAVGDEVIVNVPEGCMSSSVVAPATACTLLPRGLSFAEGAAFLVAYATAYHCLLERAKTAPHDAVLVLGSTGGVGLAAVQIAKAIGCKTIIGVGSGREKLAVVGQSGASHLIDLASPDMSGSNLGVRLKSITGGRGVDVVFDPVGGELFDMALRGTAWAARVCVVGFASGSRQNIPANYALIKGLTVMGCRAGQSVRMDPSLQAPRMAQLLKWVAEGRLRPHISHTFPPEKVQDAFRTLLERKVIGKVVLAFIADAAGPRKSKL